MAEEHKKEAAKLGFDLTKQFLTLAFGGIAFVVGVASSRPGAISSLLLWWSIGLFAASSVFGLLFLMRGVNRLSEEESFDIYAATIRVFSAFQILFVAAGVVLLCVVVIRRGGGTANDPSRVIEVKLQNGQFVSYPIEPDKNISVEVEDGKIKVSATKP